MNVISHIMIETALINVSKHFKKERKIKRNGREQSHAGISVWKRQIVMITANLFVFVPVWCAVKPKLVVKSTNKYWLVYTVFRKSLLGV